ncbi:MAG: hypothetical protein HY690_04915 [Chloroflexi bacterium]|nr:hypothetical protein [Chloroflexota bacterium]
MELTFERGDRSAPKGHALLYFHGGRDPDEVWATYLVVSPIAMDLAKYVPPMFAAQLPPQMSTGLTAYPLPPLPERVASRRWLESVARARDDDLLAGGQIEPADMQRLVLAVTEAAQSYSALYADWAARMPQPEPEPLPEVDVDDLFYSVMSDRDKVGKLAKLLGTLRYAVEGADRQAAAEAGGEVRKLGRHLDAKYRVDALLGAAQQPGAEAWTLAQLYVERAYKIAAEDYAALSALETRIRALEQARGQEGR